MTVRFNLTAHSAVQGQMIEVFDDDVFIAGIYPAEHGVRIVSKYLVNFGDRLSIDAKEPPALNVVLAPLSEAVLAHILLRKSRQA